MLAALAGTGFFWLDLDDEAADGTVAELLSVHFGFHPLAVQAAERFYQRPRIDDYDNFVYLVARGADPEDNGHAEVHCFWNDRYVVTVHRGRLPGPGRRARAGSSAITPARTWRRPRSSSCTSSISALVDSFFPYLSDFDDRIDALEDDILKAPTEAQLGELFDMKRALMDDAQGHRAPARHDGQHQLRAWPTCPA